MKTLAQADISLSALKHNLSIVKQAAPQSKVMAVIKADGYGHGACTIHSALDEADAFAVARIEEGIALRSAGVTKNITLLSGIADLQDLLACQQFNLEATIHSEETLALIPKLSSPLTIWLKFDTGMHRLGLDPMQAAKYQQLLSAHRQITLAGIMSHLANAEISQAESNRLQQQRFESLTPFFPDTSRSLANSGGILLHPHLHYQWIRPGIMLYGSNPGTEQTAFSNALKPVMTLHSKVIHLQHLKTGECVGYNGIWQASRPSTVATIAIGYADGYPRHAPNGTPVLINGKFYPLAGRVSMDLITVDVTDGCVNFGDKATLWGEELNANVVAAWAKTISYDLFTGITARVKKNYY